MENEWKGLLAMFGGIALVFGVAFGGIALMQVSGVNMNGKPPARIPVETETETNDKNHEADDVQGD